jgi:hypothetical protein
MMEVLGPEYYKWDAGVTSVGNTIVVFHRDNEQQASFGMTNLDFHIPAVAGTWFTTITKAKQTIPGISFRGRTQPCRARVWISGKEYLVEVPFEDCNNINAIGDWVYLRSLDDGLKDDVFHTHYVEVLEIIREG